MPLLEGIVEDIVFRNEDNGWTVLSLKPEKGREFTVVGIMPFVNTGEYLEVEGEWTEHRDYGRQLKADKYEAVQPKTKTAAEKYLATGIIRGIGPATAKILIKKFGSNIFDIIENEPERLLEVDGIGPKKAQMITESYEEQRKTRVVMIFLTGLGLLPNVANKIRLRYGDRCEMIVRSDPYRLVDDVQGVGFKTADSIALSMGFQKFDDKRIRSGIKYILQDNVNNLGHTYLPKETVINEASALLGVEKTLAERALMQLTMMGETITEELDGEICVFLRTLYEAEADVAFRLTKLIKNGKNTDYSSEIQRIAFETENESGMALSENQINALLTASRSSVCVITGGPGTGKTTLVKCLISVFEKEGKIELCAPTGRAAKRMTEATGRESRTVHRLLEYSGQEELFLKNPDSPLDADTVIVDEMSMVDIFLMRSLLKALKSGTRLILTGDADQLPSVGAGNVLNDLIQSGAVPVVKLTEIFRQAEKSDIVLNAHRINKGIAPVVNGKGTDFFLERLNTPLQAAESAVKLVKTRLPKFMNLDPMRDIQVMTPMKKGEAGVYALNSLLQNTLNPKENKSEIRKGDTVFRLGDKVMQIKNNYSIEWRRGKETGEGAFNGDIGYITQVDEEEKTITVTFEDGRESVYEDDLLEEIELAYCMSVHKSQGSEFEAVVIVLVSGPPMLMTRNLLYTAVTRAKRLVVITGREDSLNRMVENNHVRKRYSALRQRLIEVNGGGISC